MSTITSITAREILDSRGTPAVEVDVGLSDGAYGRAAVPSGASTGATEAHELRDAGSHRFGGLGVQQAVANVRQIIASELAGRSVLDQSALDRALIDLDGTENKSRLGANAILGVSMAIAHAAARSEGVPLYRYFAQGAPPTLPVPMLNIINGGRHAEGSTDFQEFMIVPAGFNSFRMALRAGVEIYQTLKATLRSQGMATTVGDEGGFAPALASNQDALDLLRDAVSEAGYALGDQVFIALDVAASELSSHGDGRYELPREGTVLEPGELVDRYERWANAYHIISIEDGMAEEDWAGWTSMTQRLGSTVQLVGDDLLTTNPHRIKRGIDLGAGNALLVKPNQIGTVTETLEAMELAKAAGWGTVLSHRSGETEDTTIADFAVATSAGQIKSGAPARGERTAKYNRLLRIEEELGDDARFAGRAVYGHFGLQGGPSYS